MYRMWNWLKNRDYDWKYKLRVCLPLSIVLIAIDWLSKLAVIKTMELGETSSFIPHFLRLNYSINLGSAFGQNQSNPVLAIILATIFTFAALLLIIFGNDRKWLVGLTFLTGGSLANVLGRVWSPPTSLDGRVYYSGVVDFFQFEFHFLGSDGYIFNLADVFVIVGIVLVVLVLLVEVIKSLYRRPSNKKTKSAVEPMPEREQREASQNDH